MLPGRRQWALLGWLHTPQDFLVAGHSLLLVASLGKELPEHHLRSGRADLHGRELREGKDRE